MRIIIVFKYLEWNTAETHDKVYSQDCPSLPFFKIREISDTLSLECSTVYKLTQSDCILKR